MHWLREEDVMKTCTKCGETKEFNAFYKNKTKKDGYNSYCKQCSNTYHKEYVKENKKAIEEYKKEYYKQNREETIKRRLTRYRNNKEEEKNKHKQYYYNNKDKFRLYGIKRKALERASIPLFLKRCNKEKQRVTNIYKLRALLSKNTGVMHHVDHMWPVADGGPHWSGNLQIICAQDNWSKAAKVDPAIKATIQEMLAEEERLHAEH